MKPFWFAFNVTDWLSSKSVRMMSLLERGAYIGLLATAWGEDTPGTLPADADEVRRLAEMTPEQWTVSAPCLLKKFPLSECGTYRYNPRLLAEGQEQKRKSELAAEAGRRSAEAKKQRKGNGTSTDVGKKSTDVEKMATERQLDTTTITSTSDEVLREAPSPSPPVLKAEVGGQALAPNPARDAALALTDQQDEQPVDASPLTKPTGFRLMCERNNFVGIDYEHYRTQAYAAAVRAKAKPRTVIQWESWVVKYLNNQGSPASLVRPGIGPKASPDPEADRLRAVAAQAKAEQPVAGYVPYQSKPNQPGGASEPVKPYGPTSTAPRF